MAIEGNSNKSKEQKAIQPAQTKALPEKTGFLDMFLKRDAKNIRDFLVETILIPSLIDGVSGIGGIIIDSAKEAIGRAFDSMGFEASNVRSKSGYTNYSRVNGGRKRDYEYVSSETEKTTYKNVRLKNEAEARAVIGAMSDRIEASGAVRVAELFDIASEVLGDSDAYVAQFTDWNYGWKDVRNATWTRTIHKDRPVLLVLPKPIDMGKD